MVQERLHLYRYTLSAARIFRASTATNALTLCRGKGGRDGDDQGCNTGEVAFPAASNRRPRRKRRRRSKARFRRRCPLLKWAIPKMARKSSSRSRTTRSYPPLFGLAVYELQASPGPQRLSDRKPCERRSASNEAQPIHSSSATFWPPRSSTPGLSC